MKTDEKYTITDGILLRKSGNGFRVVEDHVEKPRHIEVAFHSDSPESIIPVTVGPASPIGGKRWEKKLIKNHVQIFKCARDILRSKLFHTTAGKIYDLVLVRGDYVHHYTGSDIDCINSFAVENDYHMGRELNSEVAALLRLELTDERLQSLGLNCVIILHEPFVSGDETRDVLSFGCGDVPNWMSVAELDDFPALTSKTALVFLLSDLK